MNEETENTRAVSLQAQTGEGFTQLVSIMRRLLAPDGCPWDREQDELSLRKYVLEEAAEVVDAIDDGDDAGLCEELGDLSLQVAFLSELGRARGVFGPDDVFASICDKMIRRHPHVFGSTQVGSSADVVDNWEAIKQQEKPNKPRALLGICRATSRPWPAPRSCPSAPPRLVSIGPMAPAPAKK